MNLKRRDFIQLSALTAGTAVIGGLQSCKTGSEKTGMGSALDSLSAMTKDVLPITVDERKERIAKAQRLLTEQKM